MYCHHTSSLAFVCLVNSACLHTLLFVTYFSQSQAHTQSCNIIGHLRTHSQSRNIIGYLCTHSQSRNIISYLCTHSTSHNTIGQCLLYNLSHTAVSLALYAVDKGLRGRNVLQSLLLILLRICSRSIRLIILLCWLSQHHPSFMGIYVLYKQSTASKQFPWCFLVFLPGTYSMATMTSFCMQHLSAWRTQLSLNNFCMH